MKRGAEHLFGISSPVTTFLFLSLIQEEAPVTDTPGGLGGAGSWIILLSALALLSYVAGACCCKIYPKSRRFLWFLPNQFLRFAGNWLFLILAAFFITSVLLPISLVAVRLTSPARPFDINEPGILLVTLGVTFTLVAVLNTIAIINRQMRTITDFEQLFYRVAETTKQIQDRHPPKLLSTKFPEQVYLLDYTPLIGEISAEDLTEEIPREKKVAHQIFLEFKRLTSLDFCKGDFVFLPSRNLLPGRDAAATEETGAPAIGGEPGDLEHFYLRFPSVSTANQLKKRVNDAEEAMRKLDDGRISVWRSRRIHSEHYFVTADSATTFYVTPERNGKTNELKGEVTEDHDRVNFLRNVVQDYIREAITPAPKEEEGSLYLQFRVGQENIEAIEVYYGDTEADLGTKALQGKAKNKDKNYEEIPVTNSGLLEAGKQFPCAKVGNRQFLRVRLRKTARPGMGDTKLRSEFSYILPTRIDCQPSRSVVPSRNETRYSAITIEDPHPTQRRREACQLRNSESGRVVHLRAVIEVTNLCHHNCLYCGMRVENKSLPRYVMKKDEILACARKAADDGVKTIMIQGADHLRYDIVELGQVVHTITRDFEQVILICLGDRPLEDYRMLHNAGATQAIIKFETSNERIYSALRPHSTLEKRLGLIRSLAAMGYQLSSGFILGLPGTNGDDTKGDLELTDRLIKETSLFAASISPFVPNSQSPLAQERMLPLDAVLDCIAELRYIGPRLRIPAVSALNLLAEAEGRSESGQLLGLESGANVITVNYTPELHQPSYLIYTGKRSIVELDYAKDITAKAGLELD